MQTIIFWLLVAIALLVCAIAGLIIYISGLQAKLKASYASNREIYKGYKDVREDNEKLVNDNIELKNKIRIYASKELKEATKKLNRPLEPVYDTGDYKKEILRDYKNGCTVDYIAKKY